MVADEVDSNTKRLAAIMTSGITEEIIFSFKFDGNLASKGELNFYELSRSQYAAARFIYTLARYQETGLVLAKITEKTTTDIRARPPREGSFIYNAVVFCAQAAAQSAVGVPLDALFAMVWDHLLAPIKTWQSLKGETNLELKQLESKTAVALSKEETKRMDIFRQIRNDEEVTKREALKILSEAIAEKHYASLQNISRIDNLKILAGDLECEIVRENLLKPHQEQLGAIADSDRRKLFGKARRLVDEIGLPLRNSADNLIVQQNHSNIVFLNRERVKSLDETIESDDIEYLIGKMIQYNVTNGFGKFKPEQDKSSREYGAVVNFRVETSLKAGLSNRIIDALKEKFVRAGFNVLKDKEGNIKTLILIYIDDDLGSV